MRCEFDPGSRAEHDLELTLPPTGSVRLRVVDEFLAPISAPAFVGLTARQVNPGDPGFLRASQWVEVSAGVAEFPYVGLGLDLVAYLHVLGQTHELAIRRFAGPTRAGEALELELQIAPRCCAIVGRFVEENGAPLGNLEVRAHPSEEARGRDAAEPQHLRVAEDGRFRLVLERSSARARSFPWQLVSLPRSHEADPGRMWSGTLELGGVAMQPGDHEIGEVLLRASPPLAAGSIVDTNGTPMAAELRLEHRDPLQPESSWRGLYFEPVTIVQRSGAFAIYGIAPPGELRLVAHRTGFHSSTPLSFARGEENLRLVLEASAVLEGRVLLDPSVPRRALEVRVQGTAVIPRGLRPGVAKLDEEGRFRIGDLRAGRVAFRICAAPSDANVPPVSADVFRIDELELEAGEICADERVREIDLRGLVHCLRLHVADPEGASLSGVDVALRASGRSDDAWRRMKTANDGSASFVTRDLPLEIHLGKKGFCMLELSAVDGDRSVVLERGVPCTIVLDEAWHAARKVGQLELFVRGAEQARFPGNTSQEEMLRVMATQRRTLGLPDPQPVGSSSRFEVLLPGPGDYKLELVLNEKDASGEPDDSALLVSQSFALDKAVPTGESWRVVCNEERLRRILDARKKARSK